MYAFEKMTAAEISAAMNRALEEMDENEEEDEEYDEDEEEEEDWDWDWDE